MMAVTTANVVDVVVLVVVSLLLVDGPVGLVVAVVVIFAVVKSMSFTVGLLG